MKKEESCQFSDVGSWWCSQELPYLHQYNPYLHNGIFGSHLDDFNFLTLAWQIGTDEWLRSCYNKHDDGKKLCFIAVIRNCCIFINFGRILDVKYLKRIYSSRSFQLRVCEVKRTVGWEVINFVITNMMVRWNCIIPLLTQNCRISINLNQILKLSYWKHIGRSRSFQLRSSKMIPTICRWVINVRTSWSSTTVGCCY